MIKTIVFDFDGTIANTLPICYYAFQQVFRKFDGRELTKIEIHEMFGPSEINIIRKNLANCSQVEDAILHYYQSYEEKHKDYVNVCAPMHKLLTDLKGLGYQIAIFTGKGRRSLDISLRQLGLNGLFDLLVTGDDVVHPKPHPEGLHFIMGSFGSRPEDVIMVGDSDADIEAGKRANVQSIRVDWFPSIFPGDFRSKPDYVFKEVRDLRNFLGLM